jgi:RHS repeat-associated protein
MQRRTEVCEVGWWLASGCGTCTGGNKPTLITSPGGRQTAITYDLQGRKKTETVGFGTADAATTTYSYDAVGNLIAITDPLGHVSWFTYDEHGRRLSATDPLGNRTEWTYDDAGNKLTEKRPDGGISQFSYDSMNRLTDTTDPAGHVTHREYDGGNLTSHNGWSYAYDAQNRLTSASSAQSVVQMSYDGRNRCVSRTVNGTTTFLFYESWSLIDEREASGTQTARYVHGAQIDELITLTTQPSTLNQAYYDHHDGLGSVAGISDAVGTTAEKYAYDVYGLATPLTPDGNPLRASVIGNRFLFTGREWLSDLHLYDYRNRVYSPELGRFLQNDPIRTDGGDMNLCRYAWNNVVNLRDPSGLLPSAEEEMLKWYLQSQIRAGMLAGVLEMTIEYAACKCLEVGQAEEVRTPASILITLAGLPVFGYTQYIVKLRVTRTRETGWAILDCDWSYVATPIGDPVDP